MIEENEMIAKYKRDKNSVSWEEYTMMFGCDINDTDEYNNWIDLWKNLSYEDAKFEMLDSGLLTPSEHLTKFGVNSSSEQIAKVSKIDITLLKNDLEKDGVLFSDKKAGVIKTNTTKFSIEKSNKEIILNINNTQSIPLEGVFYSDLLETLQKANILDNPIYGLTSIISPLEVAFLLAFVKATEENKKDIKVGYVYLIQSETGLIKIGRTNNVSKRFNSLNTQSSVSLHLIKYYKLSRYFEFETMLHRKFKKYNEHAEWFAIDQDVLVKETDKLYRDFTA